MSWNVNKAWFNKIGKACIQFQVLYMYWYRSFEKHGNLCVSQGVILIVRKGLSSYFGLITIPRIAKGDYGLRKTVGILVVNRTKDTTWTGPLLGIGGRECKHWELYWRKREMQVHRIEDLQLNSEIKHEYRSTLYDLI